MITSGPARSQDIVVQAAEDRTNAVLSYRLIKKIENSVMAAVEEGIMEASGTFLVSWEDGDERVVRASLTTARATLSELGFQVAELTLLPLTAEGVTVAYRVTY